MKVKSITPAGKADVYNLEVEETHDFIIQGGIVSHNCADALRYMCMSRPITPRKPEPEDPFIRDPARVALDLRKEDLAPVRVRPRMIIKRG